ncbi:MAG: hypothetical protein ACFFEK_13115 [Candidatus Thorarchaeota archaeon]
MQLFDFLIFPLDILFMILLIELIILIPLRINKVYQHSIKKRNGGKVWHYHVKSKKK